MDKLYRVLIVEDLPADAELNEREIKSVLTYCVFERVETEADFLRALDEFAPDIIVSDYMMPSFDGMTALRLTLEKAPLTPFIIVTGSMNEDTAVDCMKAGAANYVIKQHLRRLGPAVVHALEEKTVRVERLRAREELKASEDRYRTLFEYNADGLLIADIQSKAFRYANRKMCEMLGYTREELLSLSVPDIHPGEDLPRVLKEFEIQARKEKTLAEDIPCLRKDGTVFLADVNATPMEIDGRPCMLGMFRDITERKLAEKKLHEEAIRRNILIEQSRDGIVVLDQNGKVYEANNAFAAMLGYSLEEVHTLHVWDWDLRWPPEELLEMIRLVDDKGQHFETQHRRKDGTWYDVEISTNGAVWGDHKLVFCVCRDISARKAAEREMQKLMTAVDHAADWILITNREGSIEYINNAVVLISGYSREELIGQSPRIFKSGRHDNKFYKNLWETLLSGNTFLGILINRKKNGEIFELHYTITPLIDGQGTITHFVGTAKDITQQKLLEERLEYTAYYDPLTGLPNRTLFTDRLIRSLEIAKEQEKPVAVVAIDIDRFTMLNDNLGYRLGDELLNRVGKRLSDAISSECTVARFGADNFGMVISDVKHSEDVILCIEKIRNSVQKPFTIFQEEIILTLSMGISLFPNDGDTPEILMNNADIALSKAKAGGMNSYQFFTADMNIKTSEFVNLQRRLFNALKAHEYTMHYQPYFDISTRQMVGMEALLRWNNPELGFVSPGNFIPILEETGMIVDVGNWIIETVCRQIKEWMDKGFKHRIVPVFVNLSPVQFRQKNLMEKIFQTIRQTGIYPSFLGFEITETSIMEDIDFIGNLITGLKKAGISVHIDDFGTGYSSLSMLRSLPVDSLKIDLSFIRDLSNSPDDASIVITIISMAHNLNLKTIAEGVETEEQWNILRILKCDMAQGYYFSKPVSAQDVEKYFE